MSVSIIAEEIEMSSAYVLVAFAVCILLMILFISKWKTVKMVLIPVIHIQSEPACHSNFVSVPPEHF